MLPKNRVLSLRLPEDVIDYFRTPDHTGYVSRIQAAITSWVRRRRISLVLAVHNNDIQSVRAYLAAEDADPNQSDSTGTTPLAWAVRYNRIPIALVLLAAGADPNCMSARGTGCTVLGDAATEGRLPLVMMLLSVGAEMGADTTYLARTPLHYAALRGHRDVVQVLLAAGADPTVADAEGLTPAAVARRAVNLNPRRREEYQAIADLLPPVPGAAEGAEGTA